MMKFITLLLVSLCGLAAISAGNIESTSYLVESLPEKKFHLELLPGIKPTWKALIALVDTTQDTLDVTAMYFDLTLSAVSYLLWNTYTPFPMKFIHVTFSPLFYISTADDSPSQRLKRRIRVSWHAVSRLYNTSGGTIHLKFSWISKLALHINSPEISVNRASFIPIVISPPSTMCFVEHVLIDVINMAYMHNLKPISKLAWNWLTSSCKRLGQTNIITSASISTLSTLSNSVLFKTLFSQVASFHIIFPSRYFQLVFHSQLSTQFQNCLNL